MLDNYGQFHPMGRIRNKILAAFIAVTLIPLLLLSYFISSEVMVLTQAMQTATTAKDIRQIDQVIGNFVESMQEDVNYLASQPQLRGVDGSITAYMDKTGDAQGIIIQTPMQNGGLEAELFTLFERFRAAHPRVEFMSYAVAENGGYVQSPATTRKAGYDPRVRAWYQLATANQDEIMITEPYLTSNAEALEISFVKAVHDERGKFKGVLSVDITLKGFTDRVKDIRGGHSGFMVVTDKKGTIIAHTADSSMVFKPVTELGLEQIDKLMAINNGDFNIMVDGRNTTVHVRTSGATGWKIIDFVDSQEIVDAATKKRNTVLLFALIVILLAAVLGVILAQTIAKPICQVVAVAEAIAAGDMTAPRKLNLRGTSNDEIGVLVNSINTMTVKLEQSFNELEENTKRKVVEQTLRQQNEYLALLHQTALSLMNQLDLDTVLAMIVSSAAKLVETPHGFIYLLDKEKGIFTRSHGLGIYERDIGRQIPIDQGMVGEVYKTGAPVVVDDYSTWGQRFLPDAEFAKLRSMLQVPLKSETAVIGSIGLAYIEESGSFGREEIQLLSRFAELASIALENARLHTALQVELGERQKAETALTKSETGNRALLAAIPDAIFRFNGEGTLLDFRLGKEQIFWLSPGAITGCKLAEVIPPTLATIILENAQLANESGGIQSFEYNSDRFDRMEWEIRVVVSGENEFLAIVRDVTERRELQKRLEYLSMHDALTGLFNRNRFEQELHFLEGKGVASLGIIICDVDGLKFINDSLGHEAGDKLLTVTGAILKSVFPQEVVARVGGDEFAILLGSGSTVMVEDACRQIKVAISQHNRENPGVPLSISIGFAVSSDEFSDLNDLYKEADNYMYREKLHRKSSVRSSIVQGLIKAMEARDHATQGHADRLQDLSVRLAERMGLSDRNVADIRLLAQFHDIGKVGIPDSILSKPGPLTEKEKNEMRRHSEIGYRLAQSIPELTPISEWILKHHEWWNGEGYPLGLKGEEIPVESRVVAIVDAYDAMTSDRPYRKAISQEQAIAELKKCSNQQFDPRLVELFLEILALRPEKSVADC